MDERQEADPYWWSSPNVALNGTGSRLGNSIDPDWTIQYAWKTDEPLTEPAESPLVGVAEALSAVLGEPVVRPTVPEE